MASITRVTQTDIYSNYFHYLSGRNTVTTATRQLLRSIRLLLINNNIHTTITVEHPTTSHQQQYPPVQPRAHQSLHRMDPPFQP